MKHRKPHPNCPLNRLSEERAEEVAEHARTHKLEQTVAWLAGHGLKTSKGALSRWLDRRRLREFFLEAESRVNRLRDSMSKEFPDINECELDRRANLAFQLEAVESLDPKTYLAFSTARHKSKMDQARFDQRERVIAHDREKWLAARRTKIEAGLDALYAEIKDNPEAMELFQKFKAVATKATI